jgi:branched-chain amino acid transport system substrate-binding protein
VSLLTPASRYAERFIRAVVDGTGLELRIVQGRGSFGRQVADGAQKIADQTGIRTRRLSCDDVRSCAQGPWALMSAGMFEDDVQAVNRARRLPDPPRLIFSVAAGVSEFARKVDDPEGIYGAGQWVPGSGTQADLGPPRDAFLAAYAAVTGQPAEYPGVQAAAAAVIAAHCARRAGSTVRGQLWAQAAALDTATLFGGFRIDPVTGAQVQHQAVLVRWMPGGLAPA